MAVTSSALGMMPRSQCPTARSSWLWQQRRQLGTKSRALSTGFPFCSSQARPLTRANGFQCHQLTGSRTCIYQQECCWVSVVSSSIYFRVWEGANPVMLSYLMIILAAGSKSPTTGPGTELSSVFQRPIFSKNL